MSLIGTLKTLGQNFIDLVFPVFCLSCGTEEKGYLCVACLPKLPKLEKQLCIRCQKAAPFGKTHPECVSRNTVDGIISALPYSDPLIRKIIEVFKYNFVSELAQPLSFLLHQEIKKQNLGDYFKEFTIVPVPLHPRRFNWRGFNQAELLAKELSANLKIAYEPLAVRSKFTKPQTELKKDQRALNIQNAFGLDKPDIAGKYLLVDDVVTTGSTLNELAKLLKKSGASEVWALTVAHG